MKLVTPEEINGLSFEEIKVFWPSQTHILLSNVIIGIKNDAKRGSFLVICELSNHNIVGRIYQKEIDRMINDENITLIIFIKEEKND